MNSRRPSFTVQGFDVWPVFARLLLLETGVILRPNLTKLGLLNGLSFCVVRPLCVKAAVGTPWQPDFFCFALCWSYEFVKGSRGDEQKLSLGVRGQEWPRGGGTRVHCQRRGWSVRKARYHCLYTNPSLVKDPFVILVLFRLGICPDYRRGEGNVACPASEEELCLSHAEVGTAAERTASLPLPSAMRSSKTGELAQAFINILGSFYWPSLKGETCTKAVQSCFSWKVVTCWRPGRS